MLYILAVALLLTCSAAQPARTILNATNGDMLQTNPVTNVNYIRQLFNGLLPLPFAIDQCGKLGLFDGTYAKFTCAEDGMSVTKQVYTDSACTTTQGDPVTYTNATTAFNCGGTNEYLVIELSIYSDCDGAAPVAAATEACLVTQLDPMAPPVQFRLFCSDESSGSDIAQLQVYTYSSDCSADMWEYSIQTTDECGALFAAQAVGGYVYGRVTGCSQVDAYYEETTDDSSDATVAASHLIALVISVAAAMLH